MNNILKDKLHRLKVTEQSLKEEEPKILVDFEEEPKVLVDFKAEWFKTMFYGDFNTPYKDIWENSITINDKE